jgi:L-rhamnose mutarotase
VTAARTRGPGRFCFALDLENNPEAIAAYCHWHRPGGPPAAVTDAIRAAGIEELEIWLSGNRLFMILEAGPDYDAEKKTQSDAANPAVREWERLMQTFQRMLPWATPGEWWTRADCVYTLSAQP